MWGKSLTSWVNINTSFPTSYLSPHKYLLHFLECPLWDPQHLLITHKTVNWSKNIYFYVHSLTHCANNFHECLQRGICTTDRIYMVSGVILCIWFWLVSTPYMKLQPNLIHRFSSYHTIQVKFDTYLN